jgi:hypothetical protein
MISLQHLRHHSDRGLLAWGLVCLLVAQLLFPIQAHTAWAVQADGEVLQICTLAGVQSVPVTPGDPAQADPERADWRNAACSFSQLMADLVTPATAPPLDPLPLADRLGEWPVHLTLHDRLVRQAAIRAPPGLD